MVRFLFVFVCLVLIYLSLDFFWNTLSGRYYIWKLRKILIRQDKNFAELDKALEQTRKMHECLSEILKSLENFKTRCENFKIGESCKTLGKHLEDVKKKF